MPFLLGYLSRDRFDRSFTTLSILFVIAFFCYPLLVSYSDGRLIYLNRETIFSTQDFIRCLIGMVTFSTGFAVLSLYLVQRSHPISMQPPLKFDLNMKSSIVQVLFAITIALMIIYLYRSNFFQVNIAVRTFETKINYAFASSMMALYSIGLFYLIQSLNRKSIILSTFWFVSTLSLILIYGGRVQTLVVLVLPFVRFFKRLNLALVIMCVGVIILFPLIIGGKSIIAAIGTHESIIKTVTNLYQSPVSDAAVMSNFAHPMVSYLFAPMLVNDIGYRWFWDIPQGFLFYFRLFGLNFGDSITYFNTKILMGVDQSVIPPGYLAFGYIQANLVGVFFMGVFFRFTGIFAKYIKERSLSSSVASDFLFAFMAANTFYIGEMRGLILTFFVPCGLMYTIGQMHRRRPHAAVVRNRGRAPRTSRIN